MSTESTKALIRMWGKSEFEETVKFDDGRYNHEKYSDVCLPIQVNGEWVLVICDMRRQCYNIVLFSNWEFTLKDKIAFLGSVAKHCAVKYGLKTVK